MAAANLTYPVKTPNWILVYEGVNITADISSMVRSITYIDQLGGLSGEVAVELEDHDKRWQGPWFPTEGDQINLMIGYLNEPLLPCGDFQVDQLELSGPPDIFRLRCLAAFITSSMRTRSSIAYESQTIPQIAGTIAAKYNLHVVGAPNNLNVQYSRVTQKHETDLAFLRRLAKSHGYDFTVRGTQLVFFSRTELEDTPPVTALTRASTLTFSFVSKTHETYRQGSIAYQAPFNKLLISQNCNSPTTNPTGDSLKLIGRCENANQALLKAESALHQANMTSVIGQLKVIGMNLLAAGSSVSVTGFGVYDGTYLIETARHQLTPVDGYTTEIAVRKVPS